MYIERKEEARGVLLTYLFFGGLVLGITACFVFPFSQDTPSFPPYQNAPLGMLKSEMVFTHIVTLPTESIT